MFLELSEFMSLDWVRKSDQGCERACLRYEEPIRQVRVWGNTHTPTTPASHWDYHLSSACAGRYFRLLALSLISYREKFPRSRFCMSSHWTWREVFPSEMERTECKVPHMASVRPQSGRSKWPAAATVSDGPRKGQKVGTQFFPHHKM